MPDRQPTEQGQGPNPQPHGSYSDSFSAVPRQELPVFYNLTHYICINLNLNNYCRVPVMHGSAVTNPTSIHEDVVWIPGLTQWVKDPVLLRAVV